MQSGVLNLFTPCGKTVNISLEDIDLAGSTWSIGGNGYPNATISGKQGIYLHKLIALRLGITGLVDHEDRNKLNCTRGNLRAATYSQNGANMERSSGYKGVSWCESRKKWVAQIMVNHVNKYLGRFDNVIEAAEAYDVAARHYFGEYSLVNRTKNQVASRKA